MFSALLTLTRKTTEEDNLYSSPGLTGLQEKVSSLKHESWPETPLVGEFVVFDTETTGLNCKKGDEIISFGAVRVSKGEITSHFYELVNPFRPIPEQATQITGITDEMVAGCPDILQVLDKFLEFQAATPLIAHNAAFDLGFINIKLRKYCGSRLKAPTIDTFILSHLLFPLAECHSLDCLAKAYGISTVGRHTSLGDAIITAHVFAAMAEDLATRGINTTHDLARYLQYKKLV